MTAKRPCVILVADSDMAAAFRGYLTRPQWHLSLGCAPFEFNPDAGNDLVVDEAGHDPGVFTRAHELLRPFIDSHERAIVALDCEWDGSPGRQTIIDHVTRNLVINGWKEGSVKVVAIEPELENWLWQDKPEVSNALRYRSEPRLRLLLAEKNIWPLDCPKPPRPKEAAKWVLKFTGHPQSSAIYEEIASRVSIKGCSDPTFREMHTTLKEWFPVVEVP